MVRVLFFYMIFSYACAFRVVMVKSLPDSDFETVMSETYADASSLLGSDLSEAYAKQRERIEEDNARYLRENVHTWLDYRKENNLPYPAYVSCDEVTMDLIHEYQEHLRFPVYEHDAKCWYLLVARLGHPLASNFLKLTGLFVISCAVFFLIRARNARKGGAPWPVRHPRRYEALTELTFGLPAVIVFMALDTSTGAFYFPIPVLSVLFILSMALITVSADDYDRGEKDREEAALREESFGEEESQYAAVPAAPLTYRSRDWEVARGDVRHL